MARGKIIKLEPDQMVEPAFKRVGLGARTGIPLRLGGETFSSVNRSSTGDFKLLSSSYRRFITTSTKKVILFGFFLYDIDIGILPAFQNWEHA